VNEGSATWGIVLFGDVVESRDDPEASSAWLRTLCRLLEERYSPAERLAGFGFTQGDELQGLLVTSADPFLAVLIGSLHDRARPMRWVVAAGEVAPGTGPATERSGPAFLAAREALLGAKVRRDRLLVKTGEPGADRLLDGLAPILGEMLADLTPRQRRVAWLVLVENLRQAEVADRLGVSRATISVVHARGHIRSIGRLVAALRTIVAAAMLALEDESAANDDRDDDRHLASANDETVPLESRRRPPDRPPHDAAAPARP
jgi:DNA-binding CsgD family transcriptional regulator